MAIRRSDPALAIETLTLLAKVRLGLTFHSMQTLQARHLHDELPAPKPGSDVVRTAKWVEVLAWLIPGASCLTQSLAFQILLYRRGIGSEMILGVRRASTGALMAHAWVTVDGKVRLGGARSSLSAFSRVASFSVKRR